jgi:hypothetical protein
MNDAPSNGQFSEDDPDDAGKDLDPSDKESESPLQKPKSDSGEIKKPVKRSYKTEIRSRCVKCQPDGLGAIKNCFCLECPFWRTASIKPIPTRGS